MVALAQQIKKDEMQSIKFSQLNCVQTLEVALQIEKKTQKAESLGRRLLMMTSFPPETRDRRTCPRYQAAITQEARLKYCGETTVAAR